MQISYKKVKCAGIWSGIYAQMTCRCVLIGNPVLEDQYLLKISVMSVATPIKKKISTEQLNYMADFITMHKILLHGKTKPSEANITEKLWDELTSALNALGSGPSKTKLQWKKTFIDWKSNTKKKARECYKSEQRTGGGEPDAKKLTPLEEKLMSLLTWLTVNGVDVPEIGLDDEKDQPRERTEKHIGNENELDGIEPLFPNNTKYPTEHTAEIDESEQEPSTSKRSAEPLFSETKKKKNFKDKSSNLQKTIEMYTLGQKETANLLDKLLFLKNSSVQDEKLKEKELELKEIELKIRWLEAKNKSRELDLKEMELKMEARKMGYDNYEA